MLKSQEIRNKIDRTFGDLPAMFKEYVYDSYFEAPAECRPIYEAWVRGKEWQRVKVRKMTAYDLERKTVICADDDTFPMIFDSLCDYVSYNLQPRQIYFSYGVM